MKKRSVGEIIFDVINRLLMLMIIFITLYPMYYVFVCSFSDGNRLIGARGLLLKPLGFTLDAYKAVAKNPNIISGYRVTIFVVVVGTILSLIVTAIGAFLVTRKRFALRKPMTYMMIFTMYFNGGMIPTYLVVSQLLGLNNSIWALILPILISTYNLLIMRTNFEAIPDALEEAAIIDGANDIVILFRIILPLSVSIMAVMVLYYGVAYWNSWFSAMMYIRSRTKFPLQLILREIILSSDTSNMAGGVGAVDASEQYAIGESIKYATIVVGTLPILLLYPFIQKYFVKGVMVGAVKG